MRIAFHFPIPRPPAPELDGAVQEALWLRDEFGGRVEFLYPARRFHRWLPPQLYAARDRSRLREVDQAVDLHHLFSPRFVAYPWLERVEKPVVYSLTTSLGAGLLPAIESGRVEGRRVEKRWVESRWARIRWARIRWARSLWAPSPDFARCWTVADPADEKRLRERGYDPVETVLPGVDLTRFSTVEPPPTERLVLMAGSAPWSRRQFRTKGVDLLLDAVAAIPDLDLVLLWRQVLADEIERRIERRGLAHRVEVIHGTADVNQVLARVHAAVVLAASPRLVKSFPHSLLEALAAGRPVLVSAGLGLAETVRTERCGVVVEELTLEHLRGAIDRLRRDYRSLHTQAAAFDSERFSRQRFLDRWRRIYGAALSS